MPIIYRKNQSSSCNNFFNQGNFFLSDLYKNFMFITLLNTIFLIVLSIKMGKKVYL